jgi:hypothetical protein
MAGVRYFPFRHHQKAIGTILAPSCTRRRLPGWYTDEEEPIENGLAVKGADKGLVDAVLDGGLDVDERQHREKGPASATPINRGSLREGQWAHIKIAPKAIASPAATATMWGWSQ